MKIQRQYDFQPGNKIYSQQIDDEFNNLVDAHNNQDDEFVNHYSKQADENSSDSNKDKHISNKQLKELYDRVNVLETENTQLKQQILDILAAFPVSLSPLVFVDSVTGTKRTLIIKDEAVDTSIIVP